MPWIIAYHRRPVEPGDATAWTVRVRVQCARVSIVRTAAQPVNAPVVPCQRALVNES